MLPVLQITLLLIWLNFLPPAANLLFGKQGDWPLDLGRHWFDGRPLLGPHKTWRGVFFSLAGGTAIFPLLSVSWQSAATIALLSISGDLVTSFGKRRLGHASGKVLLGIDQCAESLLPLLFLIWQDILTPTQAAATLVLFIVIAFWGSQFWSFLMYRPPSRNYPRIIRSSTRLKEWRACHQPSRRFHTLFNLENFLSHRLFIGNIFRFIGLYRQGRQNALNPEIRQETFWLPELPLAFDNFRILLLTDLHLDGLPELTDRILARIDKQEFDLCLVGGDIRMETYGAIAPSLRQLRRLLSKIKSKYGILGVLGNHDCIEMVPDLEETGMTMLINDSWRLSKDGQELWLAGLDDPHYYRTHDLTAACRDIPEHSFRLVLAHSPEAYKEAAAYRCNLYLCGHTHGGQIRLPDRGPIFTNCRAPRFTAAGKWQFGLMHGYTSQGAGASGTPLRFNCPGEISKITLRRSPGIDLDDQPQP